MSQKNYRVESVDRALSLLTLLVERGALSVSEAGAELGVAPSTAHRLLATLVHRGYAVQGPRRLYHPGPETAGYPRARSGPPLRRIVRPYLERLFEQVGETVHLVVPVGTDVRFVDGIEGDQPLRVGLRIGSRLPSYCTSGGKAMLAALEWPEVESLYAAGLPPWPGAKVHDLQALRVQLADLRRRGYGLNEDESEPGVTALGAAIGFNGAAPVAAISIAVPSARVDHGRLSTYAQSLLGAAAGASRDLETAGRS